MMTRPTIDHVNCALAWASFCLSPAEVIHLMPAQIMKITVIIMPAVIKRDKALFMIAGARSGWGRLRGASIVWPPTVSARYSIIYIQYNLREELSMRKHHFEFRIQNSELRIKNYEIVLSMKYQVSSIKN